VAKKAQKDSLTAANIARRKHTEEAHFAVNIAANYAKLKQSTADEHQERAEESSDEEPELIGNIWGSIQWLVEL
jgi:hypothetical protein